MTRTAPSPHPASEGARAEPGSRTPEHSLQSERSPQSDRTPDKTLDDLPAPTVPSSHDVVLFDGRCVLCRREVRRLKRFDRAGRLRYLPIQDGQADHFLAGKSESERLAQVWVATPDGRTFGGVDAARYLSRTVGRLWWLAPILHFPGLTPIWWAIYKTIAKNRYRWFGRLPDRSAEADASGSSSPEEADCSDDACRIHFG